MTVIRSLPLAAIGLMMLGACVVETPVEAVGTCRPDDAAKLVGQVNPSDDVVKAVTGAAVVRQLRTNQPMTMDYRFDRATIVKHAATGRVLRASCG